MSGESGASPLGGATGGDSIDASRGPRARSGGTTRRHGRADGSDAGIALAIELAAGLADTVRA